MSNNRTPQKLSKFYSPQANKITHLTLTVFVSLILISVPTNGEAANIKALQKASALIDDASEDAQKGLYEKAIMVYKQGLTILHKELGNNNMDYVSARNNLANLYALSGNHNESSAIRAQILPWLSKYLSETHPVTLTVKNNLASDYNAMGKLKEANTLINKVLTALKKKYGSDHPMTLLAELNLSSNLARQGKLKEALSINNRIIPKIHQSFGKNHPEYLSALSNKADILARIGQITESLKLNQEVFQSRQKILGTGHVDTMKSLMQLALLQAQTGQTQESIKNLEIIDVYLRAKNINGSQQKKIDSIHQVLANAYKKTQQWDLAIKSLENLKNSELQSTPSQQMVLQLQIADIHVKAGNIVKAKQLYENIANQPLKQGGSFQKLALDKLTELEGNNQNQLDTKAHQLNTNDLNLIRPPDTSNEKHRQRFLKARLLSAGFDETLLIAASQWLNSLETPSPEISELYKQINNLNANERLGIVETRWQNLAIDFIQKSKTGSLSLSEVLQPNWSALQTKRASDSQQWRTILTNLDSTIKKLFHSQNTTEYQLALKNWSKIQRQLYLWKNPLILSPDYTSEKSILHLNFKPQIQENNKPETTMGSTDADQTADKTSIQFQNSEISPNDSVLPTLPSTSLIEMTMIANSDGKILVQSNQNQGGNQSVLHFSVPQRLIDNLNAVRAIHNTNTYTKNPAKLKSIRLNESEWRQWFSLQFIPQLSKIMPEKNQSIVIRMNVHALTFPWYTVGNDWKILFPGITDLHILFNKPTTTATKSQ